MQNITFFKHVSIATKYKPPSISTDLLCLPLLVAVDSEHVDTGVELEDEGDDDDTDHLDHKELQQVLHHVPQLLLAVSDEMKIAVLNIA